MKYKVLPVLMVFWYLGGIVGFLIPGLKPLFQLLTPVGMVLAAALLLFYHEPKNLKSGLFFAGIIGFCFVVELIGFSWRGMRKQWAETKMYGSIR